VIGRRAPSIGGRGGRLQAVVGWILQVAGAGFVVVALVVLATRTGAGLQPSVYYRVARLIVGGTLLAYLGWRLAGRPWRSLMARRRPPGR
jgi:hypothetical protein